MDVMLHPAIFLCMLYAGVTGHLLFTVTAFLSIVLHEGAHCLASIIFGEIPSCIEITPLGAVMRLEDEARLSPVKRFVVTLAGPLMTLALCWLAPKLVTWRVVSILLGQMVFLSNLSILMLNLLPVIPLDGGRFLNLLLERILPQSIVAKIQKAVSVATGIALILLNILFSWRNGGWNLSLAFAGCCIIYSASKYDMSRAMCEMRYFLDRKIMLERKGKVQTKCVSVLHSTPVSKLVRCLPPGKMAMFLCVEAGSGKLLGWLHESALIQTYLSSPAISLRQAIEAQNMRFDFAKSDTI